MISGPGHGVARTGLVTVGGASSRIRVPRTSTLAGYAAREGSVEGVLDELCCRAVFFEDEHSAFVIVGLDLLYVPGDVCTLVRTGIATALGLRDDQILVTATHSHCGPSLGGGEPAHQELAHELAEVALHSARRARAGARPVRLVRARFGLDGLLYDRRAGRGISGASGDLLLALSADDGTAVATIVNLPCHPTVLEADMRHVSRDFPGVVCDMVESLVGGSALFLQGFAGDINPVTRSNTPEGMQEFGQLIALRAVEAASSAAWGLADRFAVDLMTGERRPVEGRSSAQLIETPGLETRLVQVPVTPKTAHVARDVEAQLTAARARRASSTGADRRRAAACEMFWWAESLMLDPQPYLSLDPTCQELQVQVLRLAPDVHLVALPGEPPRWGADWLRETIGPATMAVGYANQSPGYLPAEADFSSLGYEVGSTRYEPGSLEALLSAAAAAAAEDTGR